MNSMTPSAPTFIGVDVSKHSLDVFLPPTNESFKIEYSEEKIDDLCRQLLQLKRQVIVVMEATGGYESLLLTRLAKHQLPAAVVNPKRVRDFAKSMGNDAKPI